MRDMRAIVRGRVMEARVIEGSISGMISFLKVGIKCWATLTFQIGRDTVRSGYNSLAVDKGASREICT